MSLEPALGARLRISRLRAVIEDLLAHLEREQLKTGCGDARVYISIGKAREALQETKP